MGTETLALTKHTHAHTYNPAIMMGPRKDNTHRRKWNKEEYAERAQARIAAQPEPYRIWASQKSHRPKFLDKNMELKQKFGGPKEGGRKNDGGDGGGVGNVYLKDQKGSDPMKQSSGHSRRDRNEDGEPSAKRKKQPIDPDHPRNEDGSLKTKRVAAKSRGYNFDFEGNVGKTAITTANKRGNGLHAGYYCSVCDCTLADSQGWLGHLNGRRHQKNLGLSVFRHTKSDVSDVQKSIAEAKAAMAKDKEVYN